jgi:hypothetical protein
VWVGALVFFPVAAATAFSALPTPHLAGLVVRGSLLKLHAMGLLSGAIFLVCSLTYSRVMLGRPKVFASSHILIVFMLTLTAISQFRIMPRMDALRAGAGEISLLGGGDPIRLEFEGLHVWSTRVEGGVLVTGIVLLYVTSRRIAAARP